jgi:hypothetical protein
MTVAITNDCGPLLVYGPPTFRFDQAVSTASLISWTNTELVVLLTHAPTLPVIVTLATQDQAVRNASGGFLAAQQLVVVPAPIPPVPWTPTYSSHDANHLFVHASNGAPTLWANRQMLANNVTTGEADYEWPSPAGEWAFQFPFSGVNPGDEIHISVPGGTWVDASGNPSQSTIITVP